MMADMIWAEVAVILIVFGLSIYAAARCLIGGYRTIRRHRGH